MARFIFILAISALGFTSPALGARTAIRVGAYQFPPYFDAGTAKAEGLTVETVNILNSIQRDYNFEIQRLPANQRYAHFGKRIDMFLFEDPAWEWSKNTYEFLPLDVEDGEVYITKSGAPSPKNFEELKAMKIAIVKGFHYGFAGLDADERTLKRNFRVEMADDSDGAIHLVLIGVADVTVLAKSYIYEYIRQHPENRDKFTISNNYDSTYKLGVVFNPTGRIRREKLDPLISKLKKDERFIKLVDDRFTMPAPARTEK